MLLLVLYTVLAVGDTVLHCVSACDDGGHYGFAKINHHINNHIQIHYGSLALIVAAQHVACSSTAVQVQVFKPCQSVTSPVCNITSLQHHQYATSPVCNITSLQHRQTATSPVCSMLSGRAACRHWVSLEPTSKLWRTGWPPAWPSRACWP